METSLDRLRAQRRRYELAIQAAATDTAKQRHGRNLSRLDDEILGLREALESVSRPTPLTGNPPDPILTGPYAQLIENGGPSAWRTLGVVLAVAFAIGFASVAAFLLLGRPTGSATPKATPAVISSPVPQDPDFAHERPHHVRLQPRS